LITKFPSLDTPTILTSINSIVVLDSMISEASYTTVPIVAHVLILAACCVFANDAAMQEMLKIKSTLDSVQIY